MKVDSTNLFFGFRPITQVLEDGREVPGIESCNFNWADFTKDSLEFDVSGSFWDGFVDLFKGTFEQELVDAIQGLVMHELTVAIPAELNKVLAATDGNIQLPIPYWMFDFETLDAGIITDTSIEFGTRGILYDSEVGETVPASFPTMPYKDTAIESALQAFISQ